MPVLPTSQPAKDVHQHHHWRLLPYSCLTCVKVFRKQKIFFVFWKNQYGNAAMWKKSSSLISLSSFFKIEFSRKEIKTFLLAFFGKENFMSACNSRTQKKYENEKTKKLIDEVSRLWGCSTKPLSTLTHFILPNI